jgi:acyl dehydratase
LTRELYLEDLCSGQRWTSPPRKITAEDVARFAALTGDHTGLHATQNSEVNGSPFGQPIVHGLLGLSIMAGLSSQSPHVKTLALVHVGSWDFCRPIYFGDTVLAETEVVLIEPHGRRAGRVYWKRRLLGTDGQVYQEGEMETLVARRQPLARAATGAAAEPAKQTATPQVTSGSKQR